MLVPLFFDKFKFLFKVYSEIIQTERLFYAKWVIEHIVDRKTFFSTILLSKKNFFSFLNLPSKVLTFINHHFNYVNILVALLLKGLHLYVTFTISAFNAVSLLHKWVNKLCLHEMQTLRLLHRTMKQKLKQYEMLTDEVVATKSLK